LSINHLKDDLRFPLRYPYGSTLFIQFFRQLISKFLRPGPQNIWGKDAFPLHAHIHSFIMGIFIVPFQGDYTEALLIPVWLKSKAFR